MFLYQTKKEVKSNLPAMRTQWRNTMVDFQGVCTTLNRFFLHQLRENQTSLAENSTKSKAILENGNFEDFQPT